jgi:acetylornithine deacetylase
MGEICSDKRVDLKQLYDIPAFQTDDSLEFVKSFGEYQKVSYCTEAGFFQKHGIPTIIFGPGDIKEAHTIDEFIEIDQLEKFEEFISSL